MKSHTSLHRWLELATVLQRAKLCKLAKTSPENLRHVAAGRRRVSAELAIRLEHASEGAAFVKAGLPTILREDLATGCSLCEFARACRNGR